MNTLELLGELRERGARLRVQDGGLRVEAPTGSITPSLLERLRQEKPDLLEIFWRVEAMRAQLPESGPVPLLVARRTEIRPNQCVSCGTSISEENPGRCRYCVAAAGWLLRERRTPANGADGGR